MLETTLIIVAPSGEKIVKLDGNLTVGRTAQSDLVLPDAGLSRHHATFETNDDGAVWLFDENSLNGTFVNGKQISTNGVRLAEGDEIKIGNETTIFIQVRQSSVVSRQSPVVQTEKQTTTDDRRRTTDKQSVPKILIVAGALGALIVASAFGGVWLVRIWDPSSQNKNAQTAQTGTPQSTATLINPLPKEQEDLGDLIALLNAETQEEIDASNIDDVKSDEPKNDGGETENLTATRADWERQKAKANEQRTEPVGISPPGLVTPPELGGGVGKQTAKLAEMMSVMNYKQPMDFGDLAEKRLNGELVELPMATKTFYLEVGSSATENEFQSFAFPNLRESILPGAGKYGFLSRLAANFAGQKFDLNIGRDRKTMRIRLLRMFHPRARKILEEIAEAYSREFNRPLRVTSLTRSMDYQIALNRVNANSFPVRGPGSLPPHTSGCAFDLGRKHMTAKEQNFLMRKLADMENRGILDALIEGNVNACFHIFIYPDGKPPK